MDYQTTYETVDETDYLLRYFADDDLIVAVVTETDDGQDESGHCFSRSAWHAIRATFDEPVGTTTTIEEGRHEVITVERLDGTVRVTSSFSSEVLVVSKPVLDAALDHARAVRRAFEADGIL
jgi:hypothetical protein